VDGLKDEKGRIICLKLQRQIGAILSVSEGMQNENSICRRAIPGQKQNQTYQSIAGDMQYNPCLRSG